MKLKDIRQGIPLSIEELAQQAGVSYRTIQAIEAGRGPSRMTVVRKLSRALGLAPFLVDEFQPLVGDGAAAVAYALEQDREQIGAASAAADRGEWILMEDAELFMNRDFTHEEFMAAVEARKAGEAAHAPVEARPH